ncbi:hypothetical protein [Actinomadura sp. B10D3]|uniref:hypothetical protein n=1 Tax=Actinomadura sp. B10D3 TaxID=3153557 RepID=UPI00325F463A
MLLDEFQTLLSGTPGVELEWPRYQALAPRHRFGSRPVPDVRVGARPAAHVRQVPAPSERTA